MMPDRSDIEWYDVRESTDLAILLDTIRIGRLWAYVAHQTASPPPGGWLEVYVNGVRVLATNNQTEATQVMEDYLVGNRRVPGF